MDKPERDPYTGVMTTGHDWNGIKELLTPIPKLVWFFLVLSTLTAILLWILYPTWPLGTDYTRGVLGADQRKTVQSSLERSAANRAPWENTILNGEFDSLQRDEASMKLVRQHGARLFADNCAVCHGTNAEGGPGFPSLVDDQWLWGGTPDAIMETLRVGINANNDDTRTSQMTAFGETDFLDREQRRALTTFVLSLSNTHGSDSLDQEEITLGQGLFLAQCASCHTDTGRGMQSVGAPNLTDEFWIYGGDRKSISSTIYSGRMGVMPHWESRLSEVDRKVLTLHILNLGAYSK